MFRLQIKNTTVFRTPLTPPHPYPDYHSKLITKIVAAVKLKPTPASYSPAEKGENQLHFTSFGSYNISSGKEDTGLLSLLPKLHPSESFSGFQSSQTGP